MKNTVNVTHRNNADNDTTGYTDGKLGPLRDIRQSTKMLILFEFVKDPKIKMKNLSQKLGMTVQGTAEYLKLMESEGLIVRNDDGSYKHTGKGVQFLHHNVVQLRDFVVEAVNRLEIIQTCCALARTPISRGDRVGLFMENGKLTAYSGRQSSSTGTSLTEAKEGDVVEVGELEGIVDLKPGKIIAVNMDKYPSKRPPYYRDIHNAIPKKPTESAGRYSEPFDDNVVWKKDEIYLLPAAMISKLAGTLRRHSPDIVGALDILGQVALEKAGMKCDIVHSPINSAIEAAQKGLNVFLVGREDRISELHGRLQEINKRAESEVSITDVYL